VLREDTSPDARTSSSRFAAASKPMRVSKATHFSHHIRAGLSRHNINLASLERL